MKIIKEFSELPDNWQELMIGRAKGTSMAKDRCKPRDYPTFPISIYTELSTDFMIPKAVHKKFLEESEEYLEHWKIVIELCYSKWQQEEVRFTSDRNFKSGNYRKVREDAFKEDMQFLTSTKLKRKKVQHLT
jgi:hypothetical protein